MLFSGTSPRTVIRESMWRFLMFTGVAWLAIAWSVLRLEPTDVITVAGPMILFGALGEGLRALAGTPMWWLNAGTGALFTATAAVVVLNQDASYATPIALVGWYLMVRGAVDVSVSTMNRGIDRTWGLQLTIGVAQTLLGCYAAGPLARTADPVILLLGGMAVLRAVSDLVTSLRLREVSGVRHDVLRLTPERESGVAGYSAGLTDFEGGSPSNQPRHRARSAATTASPSAAAPAEEQRTSFHDEVVQTTRHLDSMIAQAGVTGTGAPANRIPDDLPAAPDTPAGAAAEAGVADDQRR